MSRKRSTICISSSSSEKENETDDDEEEEISEDVSDCSDDDEEEENESDDVDSDDDEEEENESDDVDSDDDDDGGNEGEESLCKRVICFLKEGNDLEALHLQECKAYLRKHGLRLTGTKVVCIQRIKEHWRLKDGNGEALYPRWSFVVNCTGDVCKGDVVLFTQKVYERFDKVTRRGKLLGKRTIAGRVAKESYGSAKQQHTFTIEVLWSKGVKKLHPLFPLLVKGRNLYKLKTFRQCWNNESERLEILAEKHKRGAAARLARAMKKSKKMKSANGGMKRQKHSHHTRPSQRRAAAEPENKKHADGHRKGMLQQHAKFDNYHQKDPLSRKLSFNRNVRSEVSRTYWRHQSAGHLNVDMGPTLQSYGYTPRDPCLAQREFYNRIVPLNLSGYDVGSTSTMMTVPPCRPCVNTLVMPTSRYQVLDHSIYARYDYPNHSYNLEMRSLNHFPELPNASRPFPLFPQGVEASGQRRKGFRYVHH